MRSQAVLLRAPKAIEAILISVVNQPIAAGESDADPAQSRPNADIGKSRWHNLGYDFKRGTDVLTYVLSQPLKVRFRIHVSIDVDIGRVRQASLKPAQGWVTTEHV